MAGERAHRHTLVIPELRRLHSPDLLDLEHSFPSDPENFCILVQAMIGPRGGEGEESFDFIVCTPKWLIKKIPANGYLLGRHYLIVLHYEYAVVFDAISKLCGRTHGSSWHDAAQRLARFGGWEFEDYQG